MDPNLDEAASGAAAPDLSTLMDALPDSAFDDEPEVDPAAGSGDDGAAGGQAPAGAAEEPLEVEAEEDVGSVAAEPGEGETTPEPTAPAAEPESIAIDGKAVPLAEVRAAFQQQAEHHRNVQVLEGQRRDLEGRAAVMTRNEAELTDILEVAVALVQSKMPQPPDPALIDTDIIGFTRQQEAYKAAMAEVDKLIGARQQLRQRQERDRSEKTQAEQGRLTAALEGERTQLHTKMPELKTPEGYQAFMGKIAKHGAQYGLDPTAIAGIQDHRAFLVIRDALAYREMQAKKPVALARAQAAPPLRPAARPAPGSRDAASFQAARQRLQRERSIEAAADFLPDSLFE